MEHSTIILVFMAFIIGVTVGHTSLKSQLSKHGYEVEILRSKASKRVFYRVQRKRLEPLEGDTVDNTPYDWVVPVETK